MISYTACPNHSYIWQLTIYNGDNAQTMDFAYYVPRVILHPQHLEFTL